MKFLAYLRGIETRNRKVYMGLFEAFLAYLRGIETLGAETGS